MPSYKKYSSEQYEAFLKQPFSNNFGISEETVASWFMGQAGARPVINSYGVTKENLLSTYIPRLKEAFEGGYFVFLAVTVTEGGGAGNWVNHYMNDTSSGGLNTMNDDIEYIYTTFNKQFPPAISAPEVGGAYVEDVPGNTNATYNAVPNNSIGSYFMPSTMAGNAWIFGENWCLANQGAAPPAVYFGNPYDDIIATIQSTGADPFGDTPAKQNPDPPAPTPEENKGDQPSELDDLMKNLANAIIDMFEKALNHHVYSIADKEGYTNNGIQVMKTYNNTYKVSYRSNFLEALNSILNTKDTGQNNSGNGQMNKPKPEDPDGGSISAGKDTTTLDRIYKWADERQGQSFDTDGWYGAQCVDLISWISREMNLGLDTSGDYAKNIWNNPVPEGWEKVIGNPNDDNASAQIWNSLPNGAIVWFTNSWAGHVGIKAGEWALTLNQNVDDPNGLGGPIRKTQLASWVANGNGFLGAWVTK